MAVPSPTPVTTPLASTVTTVSSELDQTTVSVVVRGSTEAVRVSGTAVQGCGPAFVCMFVEALADGAVKCGIPRAKAYEYAVQTLRGTAVLLEESGKHPAQVKDMVTSPAGSTIEGVAALEENGFRHAVIEAVVKSYEKNVKLK